MEYLNQTRVRGVIGNARVQAIGDTEMVTFSVATEHAFKDGDGAVVVDTTWHLVKAYKKAGMPDFGELQKGTRVEVDGRLRNIHYIAANGEDRTMTEILADNLSIVRQ